MKQARLPQGLEKTRAVRAMFDTIAPRYEMVNRLISFGLDNRWRRVALRRANFAPNATVLDLAAGTGDFCRLLQTAGHLAIGVDFSLGMLQAARTTAPLLQADVLSLPAPDESVDGVTCGFALRNFSDLDAFFAELHRTLKPGGRIALLDAAQPTSSLVKLGHSLWFGKVVPRIGGLFSDSNAYQYLPQSLAYLPEPATLVKMIENAGFQNVERYELTLGAAQLLTATRSAR